MGGHAGSNGAECQQLDKTLDPISTTKPGRATTETQQRKEVVQVISNGSSTLQPLKIEPSRGSSRSTQKYLRAA